MCLLSNDLLQVKVDKVMYGIMRLHCIYNIILYYGWSQWPITNSDSSWYLDTERDSILPDGTTVIPILCAECRHRTLHGNLQHKARQECKTHAKKYEQGPTPRGTKLDVALCPYEWMQSAF